MPEGHAPSTATPRGGQPASLWVPERPENIRRLISETPPDLSRWRAWHPDHLYLSEAKMSNAGSKSYVFPLFTEAFLRISF